MYLGRAVELGEPVHVDDVVEVVEVEARAAAGGEEDDVVLERQPRPLGRREHRHRCADHQLAPSLSCVVNWYASAARPQSASGWVLNFF